MTKIKSIYFRTYQSRVSTIEIKFEDESEVRLSPSVAEAILIEYLEKADYTIGKSSRQKYDHIQLVR